MKTDKYVGGYRFRIHNRKEEKVVHLPGTIKKMTESPVILVYTDLLLVFPATIFEAGFGETSEN